MDISEALSRANDIPLSVNESPHARIKTFDALTMREREVLSLLTNGESTKELAQKLRVRSRTVQKHLQRIYAKLGVKGRTAAALMVVRSGASRE